MKYAVEGLTTVAILAVLVVAALTLGNREAVVCAGFAFLWFVLTFVLVTKPPGFPKFEFDPKKEITEDQFLRRQDAYAKMSGMLRVRVALAAAFIASGAAWWLLFQA